MNKASRLKQARYLRNVKVSTMTASLPPTVPKLTLEPPLKSQDFQLKNLLSSLT